ncbi:MAG: hypothetical protein IT559_02760 [Alphaproteobacteria bacterium]|nr:hypothetical protein [Alphaproteobacteria bacterium]
MKKHNLALLSFLFLPVMGAGFFAPALAQEQNKPGAGQSGSNNDYLFNFGKEEEEKEEKRDPIFNPYDPQYRPKPQIDSGPGADLLPASSLRASLVRQPDAEDHFILRLSAPVVITGCLKKNDTKIDITKQGEMLQIKLTGEPISPDQYTVRYAQYSCDTQTGLSAADIDFSADTLTEDGIKNIRINADGGLIIGTYTLRIDEQKIVLDKATPGGTARGGAGQITLWRYPANTYVLSAPDIDIGDESIIREIRAMARGKGLTPLEEILPGFTPQDQNRKKIYIVDERGIFRDQATGETNKAFAIGSIQQDEIYYTAGMAQHRPIKKIVMAKPPGLDE